MKNHPLSAALLGLTAVLLPSGPLQAESGKSTNDTKAAASGAATAARAAGESAPARPPLDMSKFEVDDKNPEANLPTADEAARAPLDFANLLNDIGMRIDAARERGDFAQAVKLDRAFVRLAPQRAAAYGALCRDNEALGQRDDALQACAVALQKPGVVVDDFVRFVRLVANRQGGLDTTEVADAQNAIEHLKSDPASRVAGNQAACELSLKQKDDAALASCSSALLELAPNDPRSITYAWTLAIKQQDFSRAEELVQRAKQNPQMAEAVAQLETSTQQFSEQQGGGGLSLRSLVASPIMRWLLGLSLLMAAALFFARRLTRTDSSV